MTKKEKYVNKITEKYKSIWNKFNLNYTEEDILDVKLELYKFSTNELKEKMNILNIK